MDTGEDEGREEAMLGPFRVRMRHSESPPALPSSVNLLLTTGRNSFCVQVQAFSSTPAQTGVMKGLGLGPTHAGAVPRRDTFLFYFPLRCPERDAKPQRKNTLVAYSFWNQDSNLGSPLFF